MVTIGVSVVVFLIGVIIGHLLTPESPVYLCDCDDFENEVEASPDVQS